MEINHEILIKRKVLMVLMEEVMNKKFSGEIVTVMVDNTLKILSKDSKMNNSMKIVRDQCLLDLDFNNNMETAIQMQIQQTGI